MDAILSRRWEYYCHYRGKPYYNDKTERLFLYTQFEGA